MFYTYVLKNRVDSQRYIGHTQNLSERLNYHNRGKVRSTKSRRPWHVFYYESYATREEARNREVYLKSGVGREWLDQLEGQ